MTEKTSDNAQASASTALSAYAPAAPRVPSYSLEQRFALAKSFAASGLFGVRSADAAMSLIMLAEAEGQHPAHAMMEYHVIDGKPVRKAEKIAARFMVSGGKIDWEELTDTVGRARFTHPLGSPCVVEWTIERAQKAGLVRANSPWTKNPKSMLRSRVWSEGCLQCFPGYALVTMSEDEARDLAFAETAQVVGVTDPTTDGQGDDRVEVWLPGEVTRNVASSGFLRGAEAEDAVTRLTASMERAAEHGLEMLDKQRAADAPIWRRLSENRQYGLEEVYERIADRLRAASGRADGGQASPTAPADDPLRAEIDQLISDMYAKDDSDDLKRWGQETLLPALGKFSQDQIEELRREYRTKLAQLQDDERAKAAGV